MATYVKIETTQIDADSPMLQTLGQQISDNFEYLKTVADSTMAVSDNEIRDDFACLTLNADNWSNDVNAGGTVSVLTATHKMQFDTGAGGTDRATIYAAPGKMHVRLDQDMVIAMEWRFMMAAGENAFIFMGLQDASLAAAAIVNDETDMIGFSVDTANVDWKFRMAKGGTNHEDINQGSQTAWNRFRLIITGSATAGNRNVKAYIDTADTGTYTLVADVTDSTRFPDTVTLRPTFGMDNVASQNRRGYLDYVLAYWINRPITP